ncbi:MAG: tRNA-modifying protein YgfZ [uncultured Acidimicrobiales bacterium]|uniref:tRNA-modifying protein YgfZ n=1 Tax=uncultured Acidimicrobiales bacterium TaxID=310071 RepID=A0A6J4HGN3_9ACTN|nr:MAG: tRNA-modifying protein YgfZ [uncultured Acidimicrobiales bacterium]
MIEVAWLKRDVMEVAGADAETYLQGQLSQDVAALAVGASAISFVLQPQGKVDALVRVSRTAPDTFVVDVEGGFGPAVAARLERFLLRTKATVTALDDWRVLALWGDEPTALVELARQDAEAAVAAPLDWPGLEGAVALGPDLVVPPGAHERSSADHEARRVGAGWPAMGRELDAGTIPAEAGQGVIDRAVSFTKGCYTGQELVARVDSRGGNVPRRLRRLRIDEGVPAEGSPVVVDAKEVGRVTSVVPTGRGAVALAYVGRAVEPPATATLGADGQWVAQIEEIPLLG